MPSNREPRVLWESDLDKAYKVTMTRTMAYNGLLKIERLDNGELIHQEPVGISFDAPYGVDVGDVAEWQDRAMAVVDDPSLRMIKDAEDL